MQEHVDPCNVLTQQRKPLYNTMAQFIYIANRDAGTRKGPGGQNFNYVKIHTLEFRGSVAFLLCQILTNHILSIASAITLDINTSQISSIDSATEGFIITN